MPRVPVANLEDARLNVYRALPRSNLTPLSGRFVVEGKWLVERLVASDFALESILVDECRLALVPENLDQAVPVYVLPHNQLEGIIGFNFHRGILACGLRKPLPNVWEIAAAPGPALVLAVIDVHDPTNLGGILRNGAAFGVQGVLLSRNCADPYSRRVLRVSMGTVLKLPIARIPDPTVALDRLRSEFHYELVATVLADDAEMLETSHRSERMVLLIGNEGHGLSPDCVARCDRRLTLPMCLGTDSLNAAASSAVFLYHFTRIASCRGSTRGGSGG